MRLAAGLLVLVVLSTPAPRALAGCGDDPGDDDCICHVP
jgi:hypothetical protein